MALFAKTAREKLSFFKEPSFLGTATLRQVHGAARFNVIMLILIMGVFPLLLGYGLALLLHEHSRENSPDPFFNSLDAKTQVLSQAQLLPEFSLTDHHNQAVTLMSFNRKWTFLFFGYTYCPDVCPQALTVLHQVYNNLETANDLDNTQVMFISIDPPRDTVSQLANYVSHFDKAFLGVTGEASQLATLAHSLGVAYLRVPGKGDNYLIDHSASILLVDPLGRLRASFLPPHVPNIMASDFRRIREHYAEECCSFSEEPKTTIIEGRK
jgi:protein SCO1/2